MGKLNYTKSDLERIVMVQLENLNAMHDLLSIMKVQNELIGKTNDKLKKEISGLKKQESKYSGYKKKK